MEAREDNIEAEEAARSHRITEGVKRNAAIYDEMERLFKQARDRVRERVGEEAAAGAHAGLAWAHHAARQDFEIARLRLEVDELKTQMAAELKPC